MKDFAEHFLKIGGFVFLVVLFLFSSVYLYLSFSGKLDSGTEPADSSTEYNTNREE